MDIASSPLTWKPIANGEGKALQGTCEVTALKLAAGGGAAFVSIYDSTNASGCNDASLKWVLDASTTDTDNSTFNSPIVFQKGVFGVCDQGGNFNPVVCIAVRKYTA
jgi:hypothetical protein